MNDNNVDKNSVSLSCRDEKKKIGDVNLKGIIDGVEINCTVDLSFHKAKESENGETKKRSPNINESAVGDLFYSTSPCCYSWLFY